MSRQVRGALFLIVLVVLGAAVFLPLGTRADAAAERGREAAVRAIGIADLCLSSDARWLRHPTLSEPGAPFHDLAGGLDGNPAGMVLAPPTFLFAESPGTGGRVLRR